MFVNDLVFNHVLRDGQDGTPVLSSGGELGAGGRGPDGSG